MVNLKAVRIVRVARIVKTSKRVRSYKIAM